MPEQLTIVIPTYNEAANISGLVSAVLDLVPTATVLIVDDNSPDGTGAIADGLADSSPRVQVLHRPEKDGIGPAYVAGFRLCMDQGAQFIAEMDADGSHAPEDLLRMLAATETADLVIGSRYIAGGSTVGWPWYRRYLSRAGGQYARFVLRAPVNDLTSGFKIYRRAALESVDLGQLKSDGYSFQIETTWRVWQNGFTVREVPITFHDRIAGKSKLSRRIVYEAMFIVWRLRFDRGSRPSV